MDNLNLFSRLLHAEDEDTVEEVLEAAGYLNDDETIWRPISFENNFSAIGNQQSDPTGALVEKIINAVDAVLMAECYTRGIDPEGKQAPPTMTAAVEQFFSVRDGRLENLAPRQQQQLAKRINLVAVGSKEHPNYLIIDDGEGQTPAKFPDTFVSLMRSNKMHIPFVQGKFNSGGTGVLQFCGERNRNYQLIVSRRNPNCPTARKDDTADLWGFTLVRRLLPTTASRRRSSMYVYLAPAGRVPSFRADGIKVLPGNSSANKPAPAYAEKLHYGTCIKLYNYRWKARTIITTEGRYELERFLHWSCLPFRVTETRDYRANYYSATVTGGWISATGMDNGESRKLEPGYPAYAELNLPGVGKLPYQIAVFTPDVQTRHVPHGVFFVVNGQVHGGLPSDFVTRQLKFDYLRDQLLVSVDCTAMDVGVYEDFFMSSRDRVRKNETYVAIEDALKEDLRNHPGLQEINQRRRKAKMESHLNEAPLEAFQRLIDVDPTLSILFGVGGRLVTGTGPSNEPTQFEGKLFPTYFRLSHEPKGGLVKSCPINRTCRVEFETDAVNDYFNRLEDAGKITTEPPDIMEHSHLWNGYFETRFRVPWDTKPGELVHVRVTVTDIHREAIRQPFVSTFTLRAEPEVFEESSPGAPPRTRTPMPKEKNRRAVLDFPKIREIRREEWEQEGFDEYRAVCINHNPEGGYDFLVNVDNTFLLTEVVRSKDEDKVLSKFWFSYGLVLAALGMIKHEQRVMGIDGSHDQNHEDHDRDEDDVDLGMIAHYCDGLAQVIVPIIRTLSRSPIAV